jgi:hypothetical protein
MNELAINDPMVTDEKIRRLEDILTTLKEVRDEKTEHMVTRIEKLGSEVALSNDSLNHKLIALEEQFNRRLLGLNEFFHEAVTRLRDEQRLAFSNAEKATSKAEQANEKRFDSINEFRAQLRDQQLTFIPRSEAEKSIQSNADKIAELASRIDRNEGRSTGLSSGGTILISAVGLIATLIAITGAIISIVRH